MSPADVDRPAVPAREPVRVAPPIAEPTRPSPSAPPPTGPPLDLPAALDLWRHGLTPERVGLRLGATLSQLTPSAVEPPGVVVVPIPARYNGAADECEAARGRIESALSGLLGRPITLRFDRLAADADGDAPAPPARPSAMKLGEVLAADPWVREVMQIFETPPMPFRIESEEETPDA